MLSLLVLLLVSLLALVREAVLFGCGLLASLVALCHQLKARATLVKFSSSGRLSCIRSGACANGYIYAGEHRRRAASGAVGDTAADPEATLFLTWGKLKGVSFTQAWLDESYVKWCCQHMHIQEVSGNRLAWLHFLSVRIAAPAMA